MTDSAELTHVVVLPRTAAATAATQEYAAERAADNPVKLAKAKRIVGAADRKSRHRELVFLVMGLAFSIPIGFFVNWLGR